MDRLSKVEFVRGFVAVLPICFKVGWIGISIAALAGLLWMLGGSIRKIIRRIGVPAMCMFTGLYYFNNWSFLILPIGFGILCIGDGYPDYRPTTLDEGSWLGRQVEKLGLPDEFSGELTKWSIVLLFQLALIPVYVS